MSTGIAVVGYGYWGPNLVRNLAESRNFELKALCELSEKRGAEFSKRYPDSPVERDFDQLLLDPEIEAVAIATPPRTHASLVRRALLAGKHVLVEKPLASRADDAEELVELAEQRGLVLMPGHTFVYSPPVNKVRELIVDGALGDIHFITSSRMNLGLYQPDGVVWDLAPHDLSILMYWLDRPVTHIAARACSIYQRGVPETAFLNVTLAGDIAANIQLSWLAPRKMREMVVVGSKRMVRYEDSSADEAVRVYDRGLDFQADEAPATFGEYKLTYRSGDIVVPRIEAAEPLALELADFSSAIVHGTTPRSSAQFGLEIVRALEAAHRSIELGGHPVSVGREELVIGSNGPELAAIAS